MKHEIRARGERFEISLPTPATIAHYADGTSLVETVKEMSGCAEEGEQLHDTKIRFFVLIDGELRRFDPEEIIAVFYR